MAHDVQFSYEDNSVKIITATSNAIEAAMLEACAEIVSRTARNTRVKTGKTKGSWAADVKKTPDGYLGIIGSPDENAIWEEFGTGEWAMNKDGRQGYWVFVKGAGGGQKSKNPGKVYSKEEAKQVMAILRSKGLDAYYTEGKKPTRAFWNAYEKTKPKIAKYFMAKFGMTFD